MVNCQCSAMRDAIRKSAGGFRIINIEQPDYSHVIMT